VAPVLTFVGILIGSFTVTSYRSVPEATDASPYITSIGEHVCSDGVAVSQDLLKRGIVKYGDLLYIEGVGIKRVNDAMNRRLTNQFDVWVPRWIDEHEFHWKFKGRKLNVWKITIKEK
jgi:3D (Asp-Asp-Asp) domain-containing protein